MNDLIEFLTKCNDEDEKAAQLAADAAHAEWRAGDEYGEFGSWVVYGDDPTNGETLSYKLLESETEEPVHHIALHDPARVLRECAARRRLIALYVRVVHHPEIAFAGSEDNENAMVAMSSVLGNLVQSYLDRPGFKDEWRVS